MTQELYKSADSSQKIVIIGGGIAGLAAASLLGKNGWNVTLLEKNSTLGGRAQVMKKKGFVFDMGPSWYMMPEIFENFFALFGKSSKDYYSLLRLNPRYSLYFDDKSSIRLADDIQQNYEQFERLEKGSGEKLKKMLAALHIVYESATQTLLYEDIYDVRTWMKWKNLAAMVQVFLHVRLWESWNSFVNRYISHTKLQKTLGFPALFLGGSPFTTPSLYSLILWADFGKGIWYPRGGMNKVVEALTLLAKEYGVHIVTNEEAKKIHIEDSHIVGVQTSKNYYEAHIVIGAADLHWIETQLLSPEHQTYTETYWKNRKLGISALMIYAGLQKKLPTLTHHSIYFSKDWKENFSEIFDSKRVPKDPSFYMSVRSKTDTSIVPKGCEELVVLVPLASDLSFSDKELQAVMKRVIQKVEELIQTPIHDDIIVQEVFTPKDYARTYHAYHGTALGIAHTFFQSLWLRPRNTSKKVSGLYYAGQYTNPGVGVPMSLVSAQIVSKKIGYAPHPSSAIFKKGSVTYYYSSLFFQGQVKRDVFTLYAYVRTIDDYVDTVSPKLQAFEEMWQETNNAWKGNDTRNQIVRDFVETAKRNHFEKEWIDSFWASMRSDLKKKKYKNFTELETYMYGSAEVIGFMMARILHLNEKAMKTAGLQGKAMQLLNIIRDVKEDSELGRTYLQYNENMKKDNAQWTNMMKKYLLRYYEIQEQAEKGYQYIPRKYLIPIKTAADMYKKTARIIDKNPQIVLEKKVKPSKWEVFLELGKNMVLL